MPSNPASPYIAVDWGTSSFRAALISPDGEILDELAEPRGILTFKQGEFAPYLIAACARFAKAGGGFYLLSGMIGSANGMVEVPYCPCPADAQMIASKVMWAVKDRIAIVPGLRSGFDDVMRGEETQVLGAAAVLDVTDALMVLPGTHSKWVSLQDGTITGFNTFMTGEFYALLSQHSILSKSIDTEHVEKFDTQAFIQGVDYATQSESLLQTAFSVRVKSLFKQLTPRQTASYLSGLVIGEELVSMQIEPGTDLIVVGSQTLCERYRLALDFLQVNARTLGTQAAWAGLHQIYTRLQTSTSHTERSP
jgi:2-dehydro-3-deoxygalactonokinase